MAIKKIANRDSSRRSIGAAARRGATSRKLAPPSSRAARERDYRGRVAIDGPVGARRELEIQTRRVTLDPAWRDSIEETIADLVDRHPQILRTHVTLTRAIHQKQERDTVSIIANAAGSVLRVEKRGETMERALRAALAALGRAATGLRRPKRALRPRRGREVVPAQPATPDVTR